MSANATLTNPNATESIQSTTNPTAIGDLVTSSISDTLTTGSDVIARQNVDQGSADTNTGCLIEYPLWRSGDNCMDKQLTENILFGLSIGKSENTPLIPTRHGFYRSKQRFRKVGGLSNFSGDFFFQFRILC